MPTPRSRPPSAQPPPELPATPPPAHLSPWAWVVAVVLGQPTAHRLVHAFFLGLAALLTVVLGATRSCS